MAGVALRRWSVTVLTVVVGAQEVVIVVREVVRVDAHSLLEALLHVAEAVL